MKKRTKWILISALVAVVSEAALIFAVQQPSHGPTLLSLFTLPFFILASAIGGTLGEIVFYTSIFLFFFVVTYLAVLPWVLITKDNDDA